VRKAVAVGAVVAALVGAAVAARPAWGLFSSSAVSGQSVQTAALPAPVPSVAGPVFVFDPDNPVTLGGDVAALAGSPTTDDVVAATNAGSPDGVMMWSPKGLVWAARVSSVQWTVALDPTDGVVVTAGLNPTAVTVRSAQTGAVVRTVPLPTTANWGSAVLAVDPATGTVWAALLGATPPYYFSTAEVISLNPETGQFGTPIALPQGDEPVAAAWGDGELVVANGIGGVMFVNPATGAVTSGGAPAQTEGVAVSPDGEVAATLPGVGVAILSSPTASPDIVPASGVGTGVAWDGSAGEFAAATTNGTLFVGTDGQETPLTWPTFDAAVAGPSPGDYVVPIAGGVAEDSAPGVVFLVPRLVDVGASGEVTIVSSGASAYTEPPDATCEVLAGPTSTGPWAVVGGEPCPGDTYAPLTVAPPAGDTWFAVRATVNAWQSPPTQATQWSVPTAGTGA